MKLELGRSSNSRKTVATPLRASWTVSNSRKTTRMGDDAVAKTSHQWNLLSTRGNETLQGIWVAVNQKHINHVMAREGRRSVEANQVHGDVLWGVVEGHAFTISRCDKRSPRPHSYKHRLRHCNGHTNVRC